MLLLLQRSTLVSVLSLSLISCMTGPDFHSPASPAVTGYTHSTLPKKTVQTARAGQAGKAQHFVNDLDLPGDWWTIFHSPALDALIRQGLDNSPTLVAAKATLQQAQETLAAERGSLLFPNVTAQFSPDRERDNGASVGVVSPSTTYSLYTAGVQVNYTFDVFGASRRQIEAYHALADYQRYEWLAAYLTLTSNIVTTAITTASLDAQIKATNDLIKAEEQLLHITEQQFKLGGASQENVAQQLSQVATTRALLPPLQKSLAQARHSLAVLIGATPEEASIPEINLDQLYLPRDLPVSIPAKLVRQRPDIQASEALLHQASAQLGVATANLYPQITLNAGYGWSNSSPVPSQLFNSSNSLWNITGQLTQPIFNGGALRAQRRAAVDAYQVAFAQYKQTVLQAFQNVADSLRAIEYDAKALQAQTNAEHAARQSLKLVRKQYQLGGSSYINVLNAEQQYQQAVVNRIQAQAARYTDTAALFQALGGGWWNNPEFAG